MIKLTRLNGEPIVINESQIMIIDSIPESKIVFMNREFFIVRETIEEIVEKELEFKQKVLTGSSLLTKRASESRAAAAAQGQPQEG